MGRQQPEAHERITTGHETIGESWEVSAVPSSKSVVMNGPLAGKDLATLTSEYGKLMLGEAVSEKYGDTFPLLVKFIDAAKDLFEKYFDCVYVN